MAEKKNSWLGSVRGSAKEADSILAQDARERSDAAKSPRSIILSTRDVQTGQWDASKVLFTTLGGQIRTITPDDLAAFRRNIATAQNRIKKGITAKQIIDWSSEIIDGTTKKFYGVQKSDLQRARDEITMAVPTTAQNGRVRFITNAGPESDVSRHHVIVEFMNYGAESASGALDPRKSAMRLRKGPLKIECDCGRWRYWFRYMATIGGYNAGRAETGFPKIKNPRLQSIACKHIVRVMAEVDSGPGTLSYLTKLMDKAKSSDEAKAALRIKQKEAEKLASNISKRKSGNEIKTSEQKREERKAAQARRSAADTLKTVPKPKRARKSSTKLNDAGTDAIINELMGRGLSKEMADMVLKAMAEKSK